MGKKKKVILAGAVLLVILIAMGVIVGQQSLKSNLDGIAALKIENVPLATVADGTYPGSFKAFPVEAEVAVTVLDHRIKDIRLVRHVNGKGAPAEVLPGQVVARQSLDVDLISGATYSSKVILKAIEDALKKAA